MTHSFTVTIESPTLIDTVDFADFGEAAYEAGCADASVSSCGESISIHFDREAPTMREAVTSALRDVADAFSSQVSTTEGGKPIDS